MKMAAEVRWLAIFTIIVGLNCASSSNVHRTFEYKYSFKPPYLAQKDGKVPFWEYGGNAIASSENVRVAPSLRSQKGAIWSTQQVNFNWWEIEIMFRVTGRGRIGADGLAFWYTKDKGAYDGTVFGSSDKWNGLGIFFDSFDNDNKHNNPYIMGVINDGTRNFDHTNDGTTQLSGGCLRDFRNKPFSTRARIEYYQNTLTVLFHNGMTNNEEDFEMCFRVENVVLPKNGHFGISAATGGLADDHDVQHFLTTSLHAPGENLDNGMQVPTDNAAEKINLEFEDYQKKYNQQKEDYKKEHPEDKNLMDEFEEYESDTQRDLRLIFTGQSQTFKLVRELSNKLDEIVGRQERTLSLISQVQVGGVQVAGGQPGQPMQLVDTIRRQEVDAVFNNQNMIINTIRELKSSIQDVTTKAETIINNQIRAPTAQVQPIGYDYQSMVNEVRDGLNRIKRDVSDTNAKLDTGNQGSGRATDCPTGNCLTTTMFLVFLVIQMIVLIGYNIYKDNKDAQAKKFY